MLAKDCHDQPSRTTSAALVWLARSPQKICEVITRESRVRVREDLRLRLAGKARDNYMRIRDAPIILLEWNRLMRQPELVVYLRGSRQKCAPSRKYRPSHMYSKTLCLKRRRLIPQQSCHTLQPTPRKFVDLGRLPSVIPYLARQRTLRSQPPPLRAQCRHSRTRCRGKQCYSWGGTGKEGSGQAE